MKNTLIIAAAAALLFTTTINAKNLEYTNPIKENKTLKTEQKQVITTQVKEGKTIYFWEVVTAYGTAKGTTTSLDKANKMIKLMHTDDVWSFKIIQSGEIR